uniref:Uncharacterized protein n=1 Tax=Sander lucioperca TaxID=283035 RepID=A0A8C9ZN88_SANLU
MAGHYLKCGKEVGTFLHALWDCPTVRPLWEAVLKKFEGWLRQALPESPQLCLLGDRFPMPPGLAKSEAGLMLMGFIVAARLILRNWKSPNRPDITDWLKLMTEIAAFELLIARVQNIPSKNRQAWMSFKYIEALRLGVATTQFWGLISKRGVRTKLGQKCVYATSHAKVVMYKNQT